MSCWNCNQDLHLADYNTAFDGSSPDEPRRPNYSPSTQQPQFTDSSHTHGHQFDLSSCDGDDWIPPSLQNNITHFEEDIEPSLRFLYPIDLNHHSTSYCGAPESEEFDVHSNKGVNGGQPELSYSLTPFSPAQTPAPSRAVRNTPNTHAFSCANPDSKSCFKSAVWAVQGLHSSWPGHNCVSNRVVEPPSHPPPPRLAGAVLAATRTAARTISSILKCSFCCRHLALQMLISVICDKVIVWGDAILNASSSADATTNLAAIDREAYRHQAAQKGQREQIGMQSVSIGGYSLEEGPLATRVRACLVFDDLELVSASVEQLLHRSPKDNCQRDVSPANKVETALDDAVHHRLKSLLHGKLQEAITKTKRILHDV